MKIVFGEDSFWTVHAVFQKRLRAVVAKAYHDARVLLPSVPENLTCIVQAVPFNSIPETGEGGYTSNAYLVILSVDPGLPFGEEQVLDHVRATMFHELNHAARYMSGAYHSRFLESCLMEGLATVFERERAGRKPLWGVYKKSDAAAWLDELERLEAQAGSFQIPYYEYMIRHGDGRRWIGYKVGAYLIDKALAASGKTIEELTLLPNDQLFALAGVKAQSQTKSQPKK